VKRRSPRLAAAGVVIAALSFVLGPLLALVAITLGIMAMTRGHRAAGVTALSLAIIALGLWIAFVRPYRVPGESMEPSLDSGERVLMSKLNYKLGDPKRGDIVVFHAPLGADGNICGVRHPPQQPCPRSTEQRTDERLIRRVVAGPGDSISIREGHTVVNGEMQAESFAEPCRGGGQCDFPRPVKVPSGHFFMMSDNRGGADDSRFWGPVPEDWIIGQVFFEYWPPGSVGLP
jgi:signal peptidase I